MAQTALSKSEPTSRTGLEQHCVQYMWAWLGGELHHRVTGNPQTDRPAPHPFAGAIGCLDSDGIAARERTPSPSKLSSRRTRSIRKDRKAAQLTISDSFRPIEEDLPTD